MAANALTPLLSREQYRALYLDNLSNESRVNAMNLQANINWAASGDSEQEAALNATIQAMSQAQIQSEVEQYVRALVIPRDVQFVMGRLTLDMKKFILLSYAKIVGEMSRLNMARPTSGPQFLAVLESLYLPISTASSADQVAANARLVAEEALAIAPTEGRQLPDNDIPDTAFETDESDGYRQRVGRALVNQVGDDNDFREFLSNTYGYMPAIEDQGTIPIADSTRLHFSDVVADAMYNTRRQNSRLPGFAAERVRELARSFQANRLPQDVSVPVDRTARENRVAMSNMAGVDMGDIYSDNTADARNQHAQHLTHILHNVTRHIFHQPDEFEHQLHTHYLDLHKNTPNSGSYPSFLTQKIMRPDAEALLAVSHRMRESGRQTGRAPQYHDSYGDSSDTDLFVQGNPLRNVGRRSSRVEELSGSGVRKHRGRKKKMAGMGVAIAEGPKEASHGWQHFGKYMLARNDLENGDVFNLRYKNGQPIQRMPKRMVGSGVKAVLSTLADGKPPKFDDVEGLTSEERDYIRDVMKGAALDPSGFPEGDKSEKEKMKHKFEKLKGEIVAGNDNPEIVKEFKHTILKMRQSKMLPASQVNEILMELSTLGH